MKDEILEILNTYPVAISRLKSLLLEMNTVDIAEIFEDLDKEEIIRLFRMLPKDIASSVFTYVDSEQQQVIVEALTDMEIGEIMAKLFVDDTVDFIEEMPASVVGRVLRNVSPERRSIINHFLQYPDHSAGSIMTTEYVGLHEDATVKEAFDVIRNTSLNKETIYTCYVIRWDRVLLGVVSAKSIMLSLPEERIGDIMTPNPAFAYTTDDQEEVANLFQRYDFLAMPVVDKEQRLVGIITVDDIVDVIIEETTEDIEKMAALNPSEDSYLKTGIFTQSRNRIFWLMFLMLSATITGSIITRYENALTVLPILIAFIPMLMDTGGNSGCQSSALIIRGLALDEIRFNNIFSVLWLELRVALICGLVLGAVNFIRVYIMHGRDLLLCFTISISLVATVVIAKSIGCMLPLAAKKLKFDPAVMAAPLITTIADALSLLAYFGIAALLMGL